MMTQKNILHSALRWAWEALFLGSLLVLFYGGLVGLARLFVPADKKVQGRIAKKLECCTSVLPHAFACYAIVYGMVALVWAVIAVGAYAILFAG